MNTEHAPNTDEDSEPAPPRFVVGVDLGTTNSAVCFVDTHRDPWRVETFSVPQLVAPGQVESHETLPSFHYQPAEGEFSDDALSLPWPHDSDYAVGVFAREQGRLVPGRLIDSAKSWLCHSGVDRTADLLPWHGSADVERLSPVEVASRYLAHIRAAWDAAHPADPLAEQDVVVTLPASFDEVARELAVQAARRAGLPRVVLIEEPQAAFYAWIDAHANEWEGLVTPGQKILVCDVGGGTTDFTLIRVRKGEGDKIRFHRVAVGDHLLLGGDNLDLALAHHVERRLVGDGKLQPRQWGVLARTCRRVKETLLSDDAPEQVTVTVPGAGSKLLAGGLQTDLMREEALTLLIDGFLPGCGLEDKPEGRASGFQEFGLPFATDAAITRHLARFLTAHRHVAVDDDEHESDRDPARPDIVLFNGGFFASNVLRDRLLDVLGNWFSGGDADWRPLVLRNDRLDLAVAHGAAYYGMVRRGAGVRIAAGLARTYYIGVESEKPAAVCLLPAGVEPGHEEVLEEPTFQLLVSEPIEFPLYVSSTRLTDAPGEIVPADEETLSALPPIRTVLRTRKKDESAAIPVRLHAGLTEIGTIDLSCREVVGDDADEEKSGRSWRLQFDVRSATQTDVAAHDAAAETEGFVDEDAWEECRELIERTFGPKGTEKPSRLIKSLGRKLSMSRRDWPTSLLRRMWESLLDVESGRRKSEQHEARWLNLLGFALRPGYGLALDDWRVAETWRTLKGRLVHAAPMCQAEWWILWRRIAGGLDSGRQQELSASLLPAIRQLHKQATTGKGRGGSFASSSHEAAEVWRFLGSLELLPGGTRVELGNILKDLLPKRSMDDYRSALAWALGRCGARSLVYGPLNCVVSAEAASAWIRVVMDFADAEPMLEFAVMQMSRRTGDRFRDVSEKLRKNVLDWLEDRDAPAHYLELVAEGGRLESEEQGLVFGESLPRGLRIL